MSQPDDSNLTSHTMLRGNKLALNQPAIDEFFGHLALRRTGSASAQTERPPSGGLSEIRSGVLIRLLLESSGFYASRADPMRRGR